MENTILIGSLIMTLTSLLSLAGVLIRTGKLVGQVERLQQTNEKLERDVSEMFDQLADIKTSVKVLETEMKFSDTQKQSHV